MKDKKKRTIAVSTLDNNWYYNMETGNIPSIRLNIAEANVIIIGKTIFFVILTFCMLLIFFSTEKLLSINTMNKKKKIELLDLRAMVMN